MIDTLMDEYCSREDLVAKLPISLRTFAALDAAGEGPPRVRLGRGYFYRIDAVKEWLLRREERQVRDRGNQ